MKILFLISIFFFVTFYSFAQAPGTQSICKGDTISLELAINGDSLQWQESTDSIVWHDIQGATHQHFNTIPSCTAYYRLKSTIETNNSKYTFFRKITVNPILFAGVEISEYPSGAICKGTNVIFTASQKDDNINPTFQWKLNGKNDGTNSVTYANSNLNNGDVVSCVMTTNTNCVKGLPAASNSIIMEVASLPTQANAGADQNLCNITRTKLNGNNAISGTGLWSVISGTATIINPSSASTDVTDLETGASVTFRWTISNSPCSLSADDVIIAVSALPTTADAGSDQNLCNTSTTKLKGNTPTSGTGVWSVVSGNATIKTPTSASTDITDLTVGTSVILRWTISNSPCSSSADDVMLAVTALPTKADAGADQNLCNVSTTILKGNTPTSGTGVWSVVSGNATIKTPTSASSDVTDLTVGSSAILRWTISNSPCSISTDDVVITVKEPTTTANAGSDQILCDVTTTKLDGNVPTSGKGSWTVVSDSTISPNNATGERTVSKDTITISQPSSPTSIIKGLKAGTSTTLRWTISNTPCKNADDVVIKVVKRPTRAEAGPDQKLCNVTTTTLEGNTPIDGTGIWTLISGEANILKPTSPTSLVTGLNIGKIAILRWTISNSPCNASSDDVNITVIAAPTTSEVVSDINPDCGIDKVTIAGNAPIVGVGLWSVVSGNANITTPDLPSSEVTDLSFPGKTKLRWTITNSPCPASTDDVIITTTNCTPGACGTQIFVSSNINVGIQISSTTGAQQQTNNGIVEKYCYNNIAANCSNYGGLYEWSEAMNYSRSTNCDPCGTSGKQGICPDGFHIPTDLEWSRYEWCTETTLDPIGNTPLATFQNNSFWRGTNSEAGPGTKMKATNSNDPTWDGTNSSNFNALPAGHRDSVYGSFSSLGSFTFYWSATEHGALSAWYRDLFTGHGQSERNYNNKTNGFSVRCLKN